MLDLDFACERCYQLAYAVNSSCRHGWKEVAGGCVRMWVCVAQKVQKQGKAVWQLGKLPGTPAKKVSAPSILQTRNLTEDELDTDIVWTFQAFDVTYGS